VIRVDVTAEGGKARISISDNGKGWPKENRQRLLEPYITTREKGTGLGLAIVARIIEQHGGQVDLIDAEPDASGRIGACFTFTLPLRASDIAEDAPAADASSTGSAETTTEVADAAEQAPPFAAVGST
jgi:two-component system nitrogen regulation sensor histidine kinase NtrY